MYQIGLDHLTTGDTGLGEMFTITGYYDYGYQENRPYLYLNGQRIMPHSITAEKIAYRTIDGGCIANGAITGYMIAPQTITGANIADSTIPGNKIADYSIQGNKISTGTITGLCIANDAITGRKIAYRAILGDNIAMKTITGDNITLEDWIKYNGLECQIIRGYKWCGEKSFLIRDVIQNLHLLRCEYKKTHNPLQLVIKLIMNSAYGKMIQKPITTDTESFPFCRITHFAEFFYISATHCEF